MALLKTARPQAGTLEALRYRAGSYWASQPYELMPQTPKADTELPISSGNSSTYVLLAPACPLNSVHHATVVTVADVDDY